jgi:hypothetical protein
MAGVQSRVEAALERILPGADHEPRSLHAAMRYAVLGSGKRVRPLLAFAAGEAAGRRRSTRLLAVSSSAYSLVRDDMPAWTTTCCGRQADGPRRVRRTTALSSATAGRLLETQRGALPTIPPRRSR